MNIKRIGAILLRQLYLIQSNRVRIVSTFYWPILDIAVWGLLTVFLDRVGNAAFSFVGVIVGAAVLWNFLLRAQQGMTMAFLEDVWARNFVNLFASPLKLGEYVAGIALLGVLTSVATLGIIAVLAAAFFSFNIFQLGIALLPFLGTLFVFGVALGQLNTAIVLRFGPSAEFLAWSIPFLFLPIGGVYYPTSTLPPILQFISHMTPLPYVFDGMRDILLQNSFAPELALWGIGIAFVYLAASGFVLTKVYGQVLRKGLLARFTSETG